MAKCTSNFKKQSCIRYSKRRKFRPKMRQNAFGGRARWGSLSAPPDPPAAIEGGCVLLRGGKGMGKGKEGDGKGEGRKGRGGRKGRTPVPDCESAKVATLKCGVRQLCLRRIGVRGQKSLKTAGLFDPDHV